MSRLYFHTPTGEAALSGAEHAWMGHLARSHADAAWDLDNFDRAERLLELVAEVPDGETGSNYLHRYLHEARENFALIPRLLSALRTLLNVQSLTLDIHATALSTIDLGYNAALVAGSDPIALAAKLHAWGPIHAWVEGTDRAWCADLVEQGLATGLYRRDLGWETPFYDDRGPGVVPLLRSRDDEPVVLSHSVDEHFPNWRVAGWPGPTAAGGRGTDEEWRLLEATEQQWGDLPHGRRWELAMHGQRSRRPWLRIGPDTLRTQMFGWPVTVYDLFRDDRAEHLRSVLADPAVRDAVLGTDPAAGED